MSELPAHPGPDGGWRAQARAALLLLSVGRRGRLLVVAFLSLVSSVIELIGGVLVVALLSRATGGELSLPVLGRLEDHFPGVDGDTVLAWAAALTAAFFVFRCGFVVLETYVRHRIVQNVGALLANRLLEGYLAMPYVLHVRRNSAELIRNSTESVSIVMQAVFVPGVAVLSEAAVVLAMLVLLVVRAPLVTLAALLIFAPVIAIILRIIQPRINRLGHESQVEVKASLQAVQQALHGHREIALLDRRRAFLEVFSRSRFAQARIKYLNGMFTDVPRYVLETVATVFVLGFIAFSAAQGTAASESFSVLGLFAYASFRLMPSVNRIVGAFSSLRFGGPAAIDLAADLQDAAQYRLADVKGPPAPLSFERAIAVESVSFRYPDSPVEALVDVSLEIPRGASVGFVGATGSGKSTLMDLLVGLLEPTEGRITVDGVDVGPRIRSWQAHLGVVSQAVYLLDDTMRRNVAFGVADADIDEDALAEALDLAQVADFVGSLPDGLDTMLGERGVRLSGGQRQRVAIARALYRRPDVIVFDEGTSALDRVTEAEVVSAVERLRGARTIVMVAHRISTVQRCDEIHVVDGGRIIASGPYDELVQSSGRFQSLLG